MQQEDTRTLKRLLHHSKQTADITLPQIKAKGNKRGISDELYKLILERATALKTYDIEKNIATDRKIQKRKKTERQEYILQATHKDLDVRERSLGIRQFKHDYQPQTYHFQGNMPDGTKINHNNRAEAAA